MPAKSSSDVLQKPQADRGTALSFLRSPKTGGKAWCGTEKDHGQALNPNPATTRSSGRDACRTAKRGGRIRNPRRRDLQ